VKAAIKILKRLVRSRNLTFALGLGAPGSRQTLCWKRHRITYRSKSSDPKHIERLLLLGRRCEYNLPRSIAPKYILDAGSQIGLATLFFSEYFPDSRIVCCEPSRDNLELLKLNTAHLPNVTILHCALGKRTAAGNILQPVAGDHANVKVIESDSGSVPIYDYKRLLKLSGVPSFDLIKVDIEGSEYAFISSMDDHELAQCKWIVGEVHGVDEWLLLDRLSKHFVIDIRKTMGDRPSKFHACNRSQMETFLKDFDLSILQK
jgi:FkbM family methyltransferase